MPQFWPSLPPDLQAWCLSQPLFFTASAPLAGAHINVSPKGLPSSSLAVLSPNAAAYVDATGSGCETLSHAYENGRVTVMFCGFGASPRIVRLFCRASVVEWDDGRFEPLMARLAPATRFEGARAVILLHIFKVQSSCGYGVPLLAHNVADASAEEKASGFRDRATLGHWASKKVEKNELFAYQMQKNADSLDGLPGLRSARRDRGEILWLSDATALLRRFARQKDAVAFGVVLAMLVYAFVRLVLHLVQLL